MIEMTSKFFTYNSYFYIVNRRKDVVDFCLSLLNENPGMSHNDLEDAYYEKFGRDKIKHSFENSVAISHALSIRTSITRKGE